MYRYVHERDGSQAPVADVQPRSSHRRPPQGEKGSHLARPVLASAEAAECQTCANQYLRGWRFCAYCGTATSDVDVLGLDERSEQAWQFATRLAQCYSDAQVASDVSEETA